MSLDAPGLYIMRQLNKAYLPRNHFDLAVLPQTVNFFMTLQRLLQDSYALCARPRLDHVYAGVCASLGTPIKVHIVSKFNTAARFSPETSYLTDLKIAEYMRKIEKPFEVVEGECPVIVVNNMRLFILLGTIMTTF